MLSAEISGYYIKLTRVQYCYTAISITGGIILGMNAKGNRLQHWLDTIKTPGQAHRNTHYLSANYID